MRRVLVIAVVTAAAVAAAIQPAFAAEPSLVMTARCAYGVVEPGGPYDLFIVSTSGSGLPAATRLVLIESATGANFPIETDAAGSFSVDFGLGFLAATRTVETVVFTETVFNDLNGNSVLDAGEAIVSSTVTLTCPLTAEQKITNLITDLQSSALGPGGSAINKLQAIAGSLDSSNQAACNQLSALANEVRAQVGKKLTQEEANTLLSAIASIKTTAGCA